MNTEYLVLSALGTDRPGIVDQLAKVVASGHCNIEDSSMTVLGGEFAVLMLISGSTAQITALEQSIPAAASTLALALLTRRTQPKPPQAPARPYHVEVTALDQPGLIHELASFFASRQLNIEALETNTYAAPHTGSPMFGLEMTINIPASVKIPLLREEFLQYCDEQNLDASFEAMRH